ncbi:hypothetical protein [Nocardioides piscis]|uniref:Uncharacterized protein n=1 Tax=Nocardioides piscis TaxID=2714938 RepID=A0A6G7YJE8_9ACTN|nr:hypothetical protein [Nocardioides piscis]QIK76859.1 hypothetical protein G7071_16910 [Nocardioides piscis]
MEAHEVAETSGRHERIVLGVVAVLIGVLEQAGRLAPAYWPRRDPESSWMIGLQLWRERDVPLGSEQAFTYGPWGILDAPSGIDLGDLWLAAGFRVLAVATLFLCLRRLLPERPWRVPVAVAVTFLIGNCSQSGWILLLALLAWGLTELRRPSGESPATAAVALASAATALSVQIKLSEGALAVAVVALVVVASRRPALWLWSLGSFGLGFVVSWVAAGQSLTDVVGWLRLGADIVGGYADGMAYLEWSVIALLMAGAAVVTVAAVITARDLPWVAKVACLGAVLFFCKAALTRADGAHLLPGYTGLVVVLLSLVGTRVWRPVVWMAVPIAVVLSLLMSANLPILPTRDLSPAAWPPDPLPSAYPERLAEARADLVDELAIGPEVLEALEGHPVSVDPWEISAVWAHDLEWQPLTVFQNYSAYTPLLDEANASALLADPDHRVLREHTPYPERNPLWETPAYTLALLCHFEVVAEDGEWSAHARSSDRCGDEGRVGRQRVSAGEVIEVPRPTQGAIAVRFRPDPRRLRDRALGFVGIQRNLLHADVDGDVWRVPEALAGGPLLLGTAEPDPVLFDADPVSEISFDRSGSLEFVEIPLAKAGEE